VRRGEDDEARRRLGRRESFEACRLRARIHRRAREGEHALAELHRARSFARDAAAGARLDVDESIVLLRLARFREAGERLERAAGAGGELEAEALYWLGALQRRERRAADAAETWRRLLDRHEGSWWAGRAAADSMSVAFQAGVPERLEWPPRSVLDALAPLAPAPLPPSAASRAHRDAKQALLALQREDGSWASPAELDCAPAAGDPSGAFTLSITAIAAQSLLAERDDPRARAAADRALHWVRGEHRRWLASPEPIHLMDYWPWAFSAELALLADAVGAGACDAAELGATPDETILELSRRQKPDGGFGYFVTTSLGRTPSVRSISFVTGAVVAALQRAQEVGFAVPDELLRRALDCVEAAQREDGTFAYSADAGCAAREAIGSSGRGPLLAAVLARSGRRRDSDVREALRRFLGHLDPLCAEQGKSVMHAGPDGLGSHYVCFDYANAAAAMRALGGSARSEAARRLLEAMLRARLEDGSFLDQPILGRAYATAMALRVFAALRRDV
jgi:hypothetical protein